MARPRVTLDGVNVNPPRGWEKIKVLATFDNSSAQANITTSVVTFVNDEKLAIDAWFADKSFEGMPIEFGVQEKGISSEVFKGIIDFTDSFKVLNSVEVECKLKSLDGINLLENQLEGISFALLADTTNPNHTIVASDYVDLPYVIDRETRDIELLLTLVALFQLTIEAIKTTRMLGKLIADIGGGVLGILVAVAKAIVVLAYLVSLIIQIVALLKFFKEVLWPTKKFHKAITAQKLLTRACEFVGLEFQTTIDFLDDIIFLKTPKAEGTNKINKADFGHPDIDDPGYIAAEFFRIMASTFAAKYDVTDGVCSLVPLINDSFWLKRSTYVLPEVLNETKIYNTDELNASLNVSFATDTEDKFTTRNFDGTTFEVQTRQTNLTAKRNSILKGVEDVQIPYALGNPRLKLTGVEKGVQQLFKAVDAITKVGQSIAKRFKVNTGKSNLAALSVIRFNLLTVTGEFWAVPKLMRMVLAKGEYIFAKNPRDNWSAEFLYNNFHIDKSFVSNGNRNQWRLVRGQEVPFGFSDFVSLINNSYFYTHDGKEAKVEKLEWEFGADRATIDFRFREAYNTNLQETFFS